MKETRNQKNARKHLEIEELLSEGKTFGAMLKILLWTFKK